MLPTAGSAFRTYSEEPWGLCKYLHKRSRVSAATATEMCRIHSVSCAVDGVFRSELGVILMQNGDSREDKKMQWKKYLMEVGSTCQGFRSADEVQLASVFDNLAETDAPALTH